MGVIRIGISSDNVEKAAELMRKEQFSLTSIADADLAVTRAYGFLDESGKLPMVTTVLIGPDGTVRWIDIQPNYRKRTSGSGVVEAVRQALS